MKEALKEADMKAAEQVQIRRDMENLKVESASESDGYSSDDELEVKAAKKFMLKKGKKVKTCCTFKFLVNDFNLEMTV